MVYEVAIIGAGPIGLELAVALKRAGVPYLHVDARQIAETIARFAPQTRFFSSNDRIAIAGVPLQTADQSKATREEYLAYLRSIVQMFDLQVRTYEPVTGIERADGGFLLTTRPAAGERTYRAKRIVLTTGGTSRPRKLGIAGEDLPHVSHRFQDPHAYFRRKVLIVGGRNSAIEAALRCHAAGAEVTMSYRRAAFDPTDVKYWLLPEVNGKIESGAIRVCFGTIPTEIKPAEVILRRVDGSEETVIPADFVLPLVGFEADMSLCRMAGVELAPPNAAPVFDERTMQTNVPGVYVAGTVIGGTQERFRVFIENCHVHVARIVAHLTGAVLPGIGREYGQAES